MIRIENDSLSIAIFYYNYIHYSHGIQKLWVPALNLGLLPVTSQSPDQALPALKVNQKAVSFEVQLFLEV